MPDFFSFEEKYVLEENALTNRAFNIFEVYQYFTIIYRLCFLLKFEKKNS